MPGDTSGFDGPSASISLAKSGDRQRFTVELRPGETTIVSWKKLIKEANKASVSASVPHAPSSPVVDIPHQGQPADSVLKDEPPANRFNAVIEKIERLYKGNETSDEDLNDVPDDDQYDTDDSFIDDAELDDYFQVDNCSTKHNGFFVNKGKLEAMKESPLLPAQQPKKRRKKNISKAPDDDGPLRRKRAKVDKMTIDATILASGKSICVTSDNCASVNGHSEDRKHLNQIKRISADSTKLDRGISSKALNDVALVGQTETRAVMEKLNYGHLSKIPSNRVKDASGHPDPPGQKNDNRSHSDSQTDRKSNNFDGLVQPIKHKTKSGVTELKGMYLSDVKHAQAANTHQWHKKDGSNIKTKAAMLEKAIKELERMVAESRPPTLDVQDADMSGQAVKRRLPREIKQKLAKVARLAQANYGEVSEEVVNRLMGFLGHTMQLRTLKRNLRMMISSGLSAKQEKEVRSQQIKREVVELVSKGLEEDSGSQIRKLYAELAQLWPNGSMDNHGIKRAICRSKDRKRALHQQEKDSEQIRKRKLMTPKLVDKGKLGTTSNTNQQQNQPLERQTTDRDNQGSHFSNNSVVISTLALEAPRANVTTLESQKKEKVKASPNVNSVDDARIPIVKKKLKRRPELEFGKLHIRSEKLSAHVDDRQKPQKLQLPVFQQKSSSHSSASPGV
uniref:Hpc2-related domain-containing protein n=1 Tax=Kalanchoe fedtschenkoi TaxID=63787 RepID=A0A7N0TRN4_KALFE